MKKAFLFIVLTSICFSVGAQSLFRLKFDEYQHIESNGVMMVKHMKLPDLNSSIVMGGLNDLDGMNNYFNIFGSKLIINNLEIDRDGTRKVVLRREDGRNLFNLFQTVSAQLIPVIQSENKTNNFGYVQ